MCIIDYILITAIVVSALALTGIALYVRRGTATLDEIIILR